MTKLCIRCHKDEVYHSFTVYCFSCLGDIHYDNLTKNILSDYETETFCEDDIICPYCAHKHEAFDVDESGDYMDEDEYRTQCSECDRTFIYQADVSITFSTRRAEGGNND